MAYIRLLPCLVASLALPLVLAGGGALAQDAGAGDYADRMAAEHAGDVPTASGLAVAKPPTDVSTEVVIYATIDGKPVSGYLARPDDAEGPIPGLIVIHEWWGLNDNIRSMARLLAGEGYAALAVDLYEGDVASDAGEARRLMGRSLDRREAGQQNLSQALRYLQKTAGVTRIGTIGWCFGGGWSLGAALANPDDVDATVIYYGRLVTDPKQLAALRAPILGLFGAEDRGIPVASVREFEAALASLGKPAEIHVYEGANHAFANPSGTRYDEKAAQDAWAKTLRFFSEQLQ